MPQNDLPIIGLTGITGSGTSTVAAILAERGGYVVHADKLAHDAMAKSEPAYAEIVKIFGRGILNDNGSINRRALGEKVFGNKEQLAKLEKIIHPRVIERTRSLIKKISKEEAGAYTFAVIDAPLLIESNMNTMCDSIWLITAPDQTRIDRIMARDSIDETAAKRRLSSRNSEEVIREFAHIVIENGGSPIGLRSKIETVLKAMHLKIHGWDGCKLLEI